MLEDTQNGRVRTRLVIDSALLIALASLAMWVGVEYQRINTLDAQVAALNSLDLERRITALDTRQQGVLAQLQVIGGQHGAMLEKLTEIATRMNDRERGRP